MKRRAQSTMTAPYADPLLLRASETAASRVVVILGLAALCQATGCRDKQATAGGPTTELASFKGYLASSQHADSSKV